MADLPKDLLGTIVEYNRFEIRAIACVNVTFSSVCKLPQFTRLIHFYPFNPWWFYVAKYHSKTTICEIWRAADEQQRRSNRDHWHHVFWTGTGDTVHDLMMQFQDVFDLDVFD